MDAVGSDAEPLGRRVFCNRALNMEKIQSVGFDLDYTLAEYTRDFDLLAYQGAIRKLLKMGYPEEVAAFQYSPERYQRGLMIDKRRGNMIKLDRHKYVKVAYHGLTKMESAERKALYSASYETQPQFTPPDFASVDTEFLIVDVCLFCQLVDLKDRHPEYNLPSYADMYKNVRRAVDLCHCDGEIKDPVAVEPSKYIKKSPDLAPMLTQLRLGGKQVFLLTNSLFDYTKVVCTYLLGENWLDYFDLVICGARKPGFLLDPYLPLFQVQYPDTALQNIEMGTMELAQKALSEGKVFQGGNWNHLHRMLQLRSGSELMYVGDHMYSDILRSKRTLGWRTLLMVPELLPEVNQLELTEDNRMKAHRLRGERAKVDLELREIQLQILQLLQGEEGPEREVELAKLEAKHEETVASQKSLSEQLGNALLEGHESFHPQWGQLFKAGHQNSRWAQQVQDYACLYTSHATNLMYTTGNTTFRTLSDMMPHDRAVALGQGGPDARYI